MKERPIIFSAPMVRAIAAGKKTQTRRVVKRPDHFSCLTGDCPHWESRLCAEELAKHSPYGRPGDRLWVRETFWGDATTKAFKWYVSNAVTPDRERDHCRLVPSIHMPRAACRLVLEVTGVRVERLNAITREDAAAEGMCYCADMNPRPAWLRASYWPEQNFAELWNELNGMGAWQANPWVWVVEFRRVQ